MNDWLPHWPTVVVTVFLMTFVKSLAEKLVDRLFRKKDSNDSK
jgi:hypothetical protein